MNFGISERIAGMSAMESKGYAHGVEQKEFVVERGGGM